MPREIRNPILPGFNPDPSICRVGEDYYIANSTFEWFPGVQLHHSRDLVNWRLVGRPLDRRSQLDLDGDPASGGIWAPCLTWADGRFWLIYTDVHNWKGAYKDTPNFLVTAPAIEGPWSEPIFLNRSGFDPSLFHDADGRKWLVNMCWDHRADRNHFAGILLQEYDHARRRLVGPITNIFRGTALKVTEGPHLYRHGGWYHLLTAEGGTGYHHAVTMARSRQLPGPYEVHPQNPVLTARDRPDVLLQKAGHADLVDTPAGDWYLVHLASRPVGEHRRCILGRETAIQRVVWGADGWLRLADGGNAPRPVVAAPDLPAHPWPDAPSRDDFDGPVLCSSWQTLRLPADPDWVSLTDRPGHLRLYGRESLGSRRHQNLVARRVEDFVVHAGTVVESAPESFQQMAGLIAFYDCDNHYYLQVTADDAGRKVLQLVITDDGQYREGLPTPVDLTGWDRVHLRLDLDHAALRFAYSRDGAAWTTIDGTFDATILSDEYGHDGHFTGAFVGLCCQDLTGRRCPADFDWFEYRDGRR
jgi:xylan 1,4-beta-xylosidase